MRIVGIDPGYGRMGVAVLEGTATESSCLFSTCIETDKAEALPERILTLGKELESLLCEWKPDAVALENIFFNTNQLTAVAVAEARGVALYIAGTHGCPVYEYAPQSVKVAATGSGGSTKKQVEYMAKRLVQDIREGALDDEYDAVAIALTCLASEKTLAEHLSTDSP